MSWLIRRRKINERSKKQKFIVAGLLLGILMSAMDNTIVATAMGTIVSDLGGFDKFVWVTSAYMVATMASMPIFGKLSDMYGRKRFFYFWTYSLFNRLRIMWHGPEHSSVKYLPCNPRDRRRRADAYSLYDHF